MEIQQCLIAPDMLADMLKLIDDGTISGKMAKVFLMRCLPRQFLTRIIKEQGMVQITDEDVLGEIIAGVIANNPGVVEDCKSGKEKARGFLVGQVMKATKGQANPAAVQKILKDLLN